MAQSVFVYSGHADGLLLSLAVNLTLCFWQVFSENNDTARANLILERQAGWFLWFQSAIVYAVKRFGQKFLYCQFHTNPHSAKACWMSDYQFVLVPIKRRFFFSFLIRYAVLLIFCHERQNGLIWNISIWLCYLLFWLVRAWQQRNKTSLLPFIARQMENIHTTT